MNIEEIGFYCRHTVGIIPTHESQKIKSLITYLVMLGSSSGLFFIEKSGSPWLKMYCDYHDTYTKYHTLNINGDRDGPSWIKTDNEITVGQLYKEYLELKGLNI